SLRRISMWNLEFHCGTRWRPRIAAVVSASLLSLLAVPCFASIFGTLRGIVHDVQHHPIADATILVQPKASDCKKEATSDDQGRFQIDAVPAGEYTVRITRVGFRDSVRELTVVADAAPLLHFPLELATVSERVEVSESAEAVDSTSSSAPATVTRRV